MSQSQRRIEFTGQYIAGQWRSGNAGTILQDRNPYNQTLLTEIVQASAGDLDEAYRAAAKAQREWSRTLPSERSAVLYRVAQLLETRRAEIVDWLVAESGSTRIKAEMEWSATHANTLAAATMPGRVAGRILPVDIPGKESRVYRGPIGDAFTLHYIPKFISFTGSTRVGRRIGQLAVTGPTLKRVGLELGGNAPLVVLDDADLERAVNAAIVARFLHQGQICMSANRIIVDARHYDRFTEAFVERARNLKVGDPNDPETVIGPLVNAKQINGAIERLAAARAAGARQVFGGEAQGQVLPPHVFVDVANDSVLAQTKQFAPIAPLIRAADEAEALRLANETEFGLSSAVFTADEARGVRFAQRIDAGMTHVNDITPNDDPHNMFGGEKNSGIGRFNSDWFIAELTPDHWITVQQSPRPYPF